MSTKRERKIIHVDTGAIEPDSRIESESGNAASEPEYNGIPIIDPATGTGTTIDGNGNDNTGERGNYRTGKRRGRPPGRKTAGTGKKETVSNSLEGIETLLFSLHQIGATMLEIPELQIAPEEAESLSNGISRVASHYDVSATSKQLAWANLFIVCSGIYGTRIFAYSQRKKTEREAKPRTLNVAPQPQPKANGKPPEPAKDLRPLNPSDLWMQSDSSEG